MQTLKHRKNRKHSNFLMVDVQAEFTLTLENDDLEKLVARAMEEGVGDWAIITGLKRSPFSVYLADISTNIEYTITKEQLLKAISETWIDFPYALDTVAGYNLAVDKLTCEDMDEIFQVAVFDEMQYEFIG